MLKAIASRFEPTIEQLREAQGRQGASISGVARERSFDEPAGQGCVVLSQCKRGARDQGFQLLAVMAQRMFGPLQAEVRLIGIQRDEAGHPRRRGGQLTRLPTGTGPRDGLPMAVQPMQQAQPQHLQRRVERVRLRHRFHPRRQLLDARRVVTTPQRQIRHVVGQHGSHSGRQVRTQSSPLSRS